MNLTRTTTPIQAWPRSLSYLLSSVLSLTLAQCISALKEKSVTTTVAKMSLLCPGEDPQT